MSETRPEPVFYKISRETSFAPCANTTISPNIDLITDPEDYLLKEHFEGFRSQYTDASKQLVGRVFNRLIDNVHRPYVRHTKEIGANPKPYPGLEVTSRASAGIEPFPFKASTTDYRCLHLANFAIRAGSMPVIEESVKCSRDGILFQVFTLSLIDKLKSQLRSS